MKLVGQMNDECVPDGNWCPPCFFLALIDRLRIEIC